MTDYEFDWDIEKELKNILKHGIDFYEAREVFSDPWVIHLEDKGHSEDEERFYAVGKTTRGVITTVRYTVRGHVIRIIGAANWRKWRKYYEQNTGSK